MIWLEQKYVNLISSRFRNFKQKRNSPFLVNASCVLCGDSKSNKHKARAYIGENNGKLFYYCHNCHASMSFEQFLASQDETLFKEYLLEKFSNDKKEPSLVIKHDIEKFYADDDGKGALNTLQKISQLSWDHEVAKYVRERQIPIEYYPKLRYAPDFNKFVNSLIPDKMNEKYHEGRLIIPFLDDKGRCFGFQGRSFVNNDFGKYITIMLTDKYPKVFGLDTVDKNKTIYVVEGCIDSFFINNCVAVAQGDLLSIKNVFDVNKCVFIPDRDIRNKQIMDRVKNLIEKNLNVCMLPNNFKGKDINDLILSGKTPLDIKKIIDDNTFQGLEAQLQFGKWRKT